MFRKTYKCYSKIVQKVAPEGELIPCPKGKLKKKYVSIDFH